MSSTMYAGNKNRMANSQSLQDLSNFQVPNKDKMFSPNNNSQLTALLSVEPRGMLGSLDRTDLMNMTGGLNLSQVPSGIDRK